MEGVELSLVAVHGPWLLLRDSERDLRLLNLRSGGSGRVLDYSMFGDLRLTPQFVGDALRAVVLTGEDVLIVDVRDGQFALTELPDGARTAGFATENRGMAAGKTLDALWTTIDGGQTWTPAAVPVDGDAAAVGLGRVVCTNVACRATPIAWFAPEVWQRIEYEAPVIVAPTQALHPRGKRVWP